MRSLRMIRSRNLFWTIPVSVVCALSFTSCLVDRNGSEGAGETGSAVDGDYIAVKPVEPAGWPSILWPKENPYTPAKDVLGRRLFLESALSREGTVSCAWCHTPAQAFTDKHGTALSVGVRNQPTFRNTPSLGNIGFATSFLFEGNVSTLEAQALGPLYAHNEMDMTGPEIVARLAADTMYVRLFRNAFGVGPITMVGVTRALATFERALVSFQSPYDLWLAGDSTAMTDAAKRGASLFFGDKAKCSQCHTPPLFTDGGFHNNGLDTVFADSGRARTTHLLVDVGVFKTPTLRNIGDTYPYMHDGRFATLDEVVRHYNAGGRSHPNRDARVHPLGLDEHELFDLVQFLESLTDESVFRRAGTL